MPKTATLTVSELQEIWSRMKSDYIPDGEFLYIFRDMIFQPTVYPLRCGAVVGHDSQSGHIYCGKLASHFYRLNDGKLVCVCRSHANTGIKVCSATQENAEINIQIRF